MEFFLPGLLVCLAAILCTFFVAPRATPMIAAVLSIIFLTYGVYDHYHMFASEYRLSTWQQTLKIYSPFLMVGAIIIYIIYGMMALGSASSFLPSTNQLSNTLTLAANTLSNTVSNVPKGITTMGNSLSNGIGNVGNSLSNGLSNVGNSLSNSINSIGNSFSLGNNANRNKPSTSFLETV